MFFFFPDVPVLDGTKEWHKYINELGIQQVIDHLTETGYLHGWVLRVADPEGKTTFFLPLGKGFICYRSECPHYVGYYLAGSSSAVKCKVCPDLLPGIVVDTMCHSNHINCPFYKEDQSNENT